MAKKTKDSNLSIEERLEQALIPNWDEPYKLPSNWCWTHIEHCCRDFFSGKSPKYSKTDTGYHIIGQQANQRYGLDLSFIKFATKEFAESQDTRYWLQKKDVILNTLGTGSIGRSGIIKNNVNLLTDGHLFVFRTNQCVVPEYLYYFFQLTEESIIASANGSTNQKFLSLSAFSQTAIPLPPLAEQRRIVAHIEANFAKLYEAQEKVQEVVDGFETRKAAILHKAFSGELTAKWREELGIKLNCWKPTILQDVCEKIVCGKTPTGYITEHGEVPFLKVYNIVDNQIDFNTTPQFIPQSIHCGKLKSSTLKPNDVIMNIVGPPLRKIAIIPDTYPEWNMNQAIVRFRPTEKLNHKFLYYALINPETLDDVIAATKGVVGQANISVSQSRSLTINIPSWDEQIEIVRILDYIINKEICVKNAAIAIIEQIDTMKKAILARAFRGELGTNDPSEESAVELLKQVLTTVSEPKKSIKRTTIPKALDNRIKTDLEHKIIKLYFQNEVDVLSIDLIMGVSSKKFEIMEALRDLQQRGLIEKQNDKYKLLG